MLTTEERADGNEGPRVQAGKPNDVERQPQELDPRRIDRRKLFGGAMLAAIGAGWAGRQAAAAPPSAVSGDIDPGALTGKLVRRITLGMNPTELALANQLGYEGYLERQLDYTSIDDSQMTAQLAALTSLTMTPLQIYQTTTSTQLRNELTEAALRNSVFSNRQLYQRMVEFWTDHFNIDMSNEPENMLKTTDDRDVIRQHALGRFPDLLRASAMSPAMLTYLDNYLSTATAPNENYGRELMELHTLGVDGGYTQQDVLEVAKCFSGWRYWTYSTTNTDPRSGQFRYDSTRHTNGNKVVLGNVITVGGQNDGFAVLDILVNHPSTARYVSTKMCRWFLGDYTPQSVIDAVAAAYTSTGGDIKAMVRTILSANVLADAPPRYKRPFHLVVSAMRALPTTITTSASLRTRLTGMGNVPFAWSTPDGFPDTLQYWVGLIAPRWNYGFDLANNSISGVTVDSTAFFAGLTTGQQMIDKIDAALFGGEMAAFDKSRILTYLNTNPSSTTIRRDAIGLALASPGFQWY